MANSATRESTEALRREQIIVAAGRAFARKGYHATTIKDIAAEADLAAGTLYLYFPSKRDLLLGFFDHAMSLAEARFHSLSGLPLEVALQGMIQDRLEVLGRHAELVKVILAEAMFDRDLAGRVAENMSGRVLVLIAAFLAEHGLEDVPPRRLQILARSLQALLLHWGVIVPALQPGHELDPAALSRELAGLVLHGLDGLKEDCLDG